VVAAVGHELVGILDDIGAGRRVAVICVCSFVCSWLLCCGILAAALSLHPVKVIASANATPVKIHFFLILFLILPIRLE
jgi:hypothetical protein